MILKDSRLTKGVTQEQVARALGISRVSVYQHEAGIKFPRKRLQKKYEEYYQSTYNWDLILKDGKYSELTIKRNTPKQRKLRKLKMKPIKVSFKLETPFPKLMQFKRNDIHIIFLCDCFYRSGFHGTILFNNKQGTPEAKSIGSTYLFAKEYTSDFNSSITLSND